MPRVACVGCGAEFPCARSFRGKVPKCSGCRLATHGRDVTSAVGSAPQEGAAGAPQPRHMTPCACHCAACRVAGHGNKCVEIRKALLRLFGKADVVEKVLQHDYGACGWDTARLDAAIKCVQYGPAGDVIASGDSDGRILFICAQTGEKIVCPLNVDGEVHSVAFSPSDSEIAAACNNDTANDCSSCVKILNTGTSAVLCTLSGHSDYVRSVAWSPDGTKLASGSDDNTVRIWEAATGKQLWQLSGHSNWVRSVAWSPDGKKLASGSDDESVRIWEAATGEQLWQLRGHTDPVSSVCFSPDGAKIVSGSWDKKVLIWDAASGEQQCSLRGHTDVVGSVCFSSDGKLTSGSEDSTVRNWNPATRASLS